MHKLIGRELIKLFQAENHLQVIEDYYSYINDQKGGHELNDDYENEHSILYMAVQHLANFNEFEMKDTTNHHLGHGIIIIKREKIFQILEEKNEFLSRIRNKCKKKIFEILNDNNTPSFNGKVSHYFLGQKFSINFDILADSYTQNITILSIYLEEQHDNSDFLIQNFKRFLGLVF